MKELDSLIGLFLNTVAVRVAINPDESFSELLSRVQQTVVDAFSHEVPFEKLVEDLKPERDPARRSVSSNDVHCSTWCCEAPTYGGRRSDRADRGSLDFRKV